jgi:hypothetical protein
MNRAQLMCALRDYDEAKARLAKAEEKMERVLHMLGSKYGFNSAGFFHIPLFVVEETYLVEAISEMKKAHYAYQDLFRDHELEAKMLYMKYEFEARSEFYKNALEYIKPPYESAREVW